MSAYGKRFHLHRELIMTTRSYVMTHHSTILEGKVIWELVADVGGETVVTAQCTIVRGSGSELNVWAKLRN